jgi:hypothetical protein
VDCGRQKTKIVDKNTGISKYEVLFLSPTVFTYVAKCFPVLFIILNTRLPGFQRHQQISVKVEQDVQDRVTAIDYIGIV